jgi:hypothetical protein
MVYDFEWTTRAKTHAIYNKIEAEVLQAAMHELRSTIPEGDKLNGVISFEIGDQLFVGSSKGDGHVVLDTGHWVKLPPLDSGPLKGREVHIPRPDSEP